MNDTFAKVFSSMYTGSMYGAGMHVFAVWGWVLANKDENGELEINPPLVSHVLGGTVEQVEDAIQYLTSPDPRSRSSEHEGRRLIKISQFGYRVVNHEQYRKRGGSRAEYWRQWRQKNGKGETGDDPAREGEDDAQPTEDSATVAQRCAQPCATHTKAKSKPNADEEKTKTLGFGNDSPHLDLTLEARAEAQEGVRRLGEAVKKAFPKLTNYQRHTIRRIVRHFTLRMESHPEDAWWFKGAVRWLDEAQHDGDDVWKLWLHLVKKNTTYRPKAKETDGVYFDEHA